MDSWVSDAGSGNYSVTYDGYGTLLTPFGTYTDVMRIAVIDGSNIYTQWVSTTSPSFVIMIASATNTKFFSDESLNIEESTINSTISAFPNPSNGIFTLSDLESVINVEIEVYNSLGERVCKTVVDPNTKQVDLSELINGIYFFTILSDDNFQSNGKIVIQK
jgi:hypothetical protein